VIVGLEIFNVLVGYAICYEILMSFDSQFFVVVVLSLSLKVIHSRHFFLLAIAIDNPLSFFLSKQTVPFLAKTALIVVKNR
jgi:hypothetical protein